MGEWQGVQDTWCFVKGGMGSVSNAIARSASDKGAHLFTSQVRCIILILFAYAISFKPAYM